jgi:hypothetical protein
LSIPVAAERAQTLTLLADLQRAVEDLLLTGLSAASDATRETLSASFQAASRMKLLRLGFTLRVATEEIGRFGRNDPFFSRRRFAFFLNRAWMLSHGMRDALEKGDEDRWGRLMGRGATRQVGAVDVVSLGVSKRVVPGTFVAFEFRLRALADDKTRGVMPLVWSVVFPLKPGTDVPPEAFLHLPQAQGFKPAVLLGGQVVRITHALVSDDGRLSLSKESKLEATDKAFDSWEELLQWEPARALARVQAHAPSPFDLEVELQEEVVLHDIRASSPETNEREHQLRYPLQAAEGLFHVACGAGPEDAELRTHLEGLKESQPGPLFGVMHYEMCRFMLQPLTLFGEGEPEPMQLQKATFDASALVRALKFT